MLSLSKSVTPKTNKNMKKATLILTGIATLVVLGLATPAFGAEPEKKEGGKAAREMTITGEAKCAKCSLKEEGVTECQTVIEAESKKSGNKVKYYVVQNDVAKDFHKTVCKENKKVTATGTVKRSDAGKREITLT